MSRLSRSPGLDGAVYHRDGDDVALHGMYVARAGWAGHVFTATSQDG